MPSFPTISLPFELPRLERPRFDLPAVSVPAVDLPSFEQVTGWARDAALAGVGLASVTAERLRELPGRVADVATSTASTVTATASTVTERVRSLV